MGVKIKSSLALRTIHALSTYNIAIELKKLTTEITKIMEQINKYLENIEPQLFSESSVAKIWGVASSKLSDLHPPSEYPEYSYGRYTLREVDYWTSGFFPGSIAAILERCEKYPTKFPVDKLDAIKLEYAAKWWAEGLVGQAPRTDTHDLGFMIYPAFLREYERSKSPKALECLKTAASALASRFDPSVGVIRSWDTAVNKRYSFTDINSDYLVIIDNMCNLNMLYFVASVTGDLELSTIATTHAETTLEHHFRHPTWSTYHCVDYDLATRKPKAKFTNQGYADESTWSRGQAWAILGYAETYSWTKKHKFLEVAIKCWEFFESNLSDDGVPSWDFNAPDSHIKDTSAGLATSLGLLIIYENTKDQKFLISALKLVADIISLSYVDGAKFNPDGTVDFGEYDTIIKDATINNNPDATKKFASHGLVYGDYYFIQIGNKLLELGLYDKSL